MINNILASVRMNKRGSYIIEGTLCLPVMVIAVMLMHTIILYYCGIEGASFSVANELRRGAIEANYLDTRALIPMRISEDVDKYTSCVTGSRVTSYGYREYLGDIDEAIFINVRLYMESPNPIGIASSAKYDLALATRAYVGKRRDVDNMSAEEFMSNGDELVYIFPKDGAKYHKKNCTYVKASPTAVVLDDNIASKYSPCHTCDVGGVANGGIVYIFSKYGESYHSADCPSIKRRYVGIELSTARERGYTPCSKCGG